MKVLIAIYSHPEFYPPTLNAIDEISKTAQEIFILSRNIKATEWKYPAQVKIRLSGKFKPVHVVQYESKLWKCLSFIKFTFHFYRLLQKLKPDWVICYDAIPLLAFRIARSFSFSKAKVWYHSHDVHEQVPGKISISKLAALSEKEFFPSIDLFSLPSEERLAFFPIQNLKKNYFILPNYPSKTWYNGKLRALPDKELKFIYQGYINYGHGLEEFISYIEIDPTIFLTIIGPGNPVFINELHTLIKEKKLEAQVHLRSAVSYHKLINITKRHHVGIATHLPMCIGYKTAAKASNKIYEYAALGLPVFFYDIEHYKSHLSNYKWAIATDLSIENIGKQINFIRQNYYMLSASALQDFESNLNFEKAFEPISTFLNSYN
ncbi:MAG: hypothetical protein M3342_23740 [Bacteroidota bacterium]|nr:hypothetical protein [Bacteroidota bacterium]